MINILLDQMSRTVRFKETLSLGDLIITNYAPNNFQAQTLFGRVESISLVYEDGRPVKDIWDITIVAFFIPPVFLKLRMSTGQMSGKERWFKDGLERFFAPFEMISPTESARLQLVKDIKKTAKPVYL